MTNIGERIQTIKASLPIKTLLIAVSKTQSIELIKEAYATGKRAFGENKAQEVAIKAAALPNDAEWHFIGHLQTNKVKLIAPFIHTIHSIDSFKLLKEVNKEAAKNNRIIRCLLQFYIATEETKFGLDQKEAAVMLQQINEEVFSNTIIAGVMGMASFSTDNYLIRTEFKKLKEIFDWLKINYFANDEAFREISMGMSGDYPIAIEEGSTMIRIGTSIFGARNYNQS